MKNNYSTKPKTLAYVISLIEEASPSKIFIGPLNYIGDEVLEEEFQIQLKQNVDLAVRYKNALLCFNINVGELWDEVSVLILNPQVNLNRDSKFPNTVRMTLKSKELVRCIKRKQEIVVQDSDDLMATNLKNCLEGNV